MSTLSSPPPPLCILVCPVNAVGHINACIGTTSALIERGHRVAFVLEQAWSGKLSPLGIKEYLFSVPSQTGKVTAALIADQFKKIGLIGPLSLKEKTLNLLSFFNSNHITEEWRHYDGAIKTAIADFKPNLILADENGLPPAIYYSGIPWIRHFSANPLFFILEDDLPPGGSGLPFDDRSQWADFNRVRGEFIRNRSYNDFIEQQLGYARYPDDLRTPPTQLMTVYACPQEWNYPPLKQRADWFNLEAFNKPKAADKLVQLSSILPESFFKNQLEGRFSGKYIYVSLGSMGSIDLDLMQKLVSSLATSPHKYIISKGPLADEYDLPGANQWGDRFLPQLDILPQVDLVITHGGNNSITEIFATGKPMIVLALFGDQYDNAQRLHETGYGVRLDPYDFTADQLLGAIEKLLADKRLQEKLSAAAARIQQSDTHKKLAKEIERLMIPLANQPRHNHLRNRPQVFITPQCAFNNDCTRFRNSTCNWLSRRCQCPFGQIFVTTEEMVKKGVTLNNLNMSTVLCEPAHCRHEECRHRFKLGDGSRCNDDTGLCECRPGEGTIHLATNTCTYTGFKMSWWKIIIVSIFGFLIFGAIVSSCLVFWKRRLDSARKRCASSQLKLDNDEKKSVDSVF